MGGLRLFVKREGCCNEWLVKLLECVDDVFNFRFSRNFCGRLEGVMALIPS